LDAAPSARAEIIWHKRWVKILESRIPTASNLDLLAGLRVLTVDVQRLGVGIQRVYSWRQAYSRSTTYNTLACLRRMGSAVWSFWEHDLKKSTGEKTAVRLQCRLRKLMLERNR
jgi:hypothetical protein